MIGLDALATEGRLPRAKAGRGEREQRHSGSFAFQGFRHDVGGAGCEQDPVAEVARGDPLPRRAGKGSEERKKIGRGGAQTGPGFALRSGSGIGQGGKHVGSLPAECGQVGGVRGEIEPGVFHGGADQGGAGLWPGGAWNDVHGLAAVNFAKAQGGREQDAKHLALSWRERCVGRPCARGVDQAWSLKRGAICSVGGHVCGILTEGELPEVLLQGDGRGAEGRGAEGRVAEGLGADRAIQGGGELAGIERVLGERRDAAVWTVLKRGIGLKWDVKAGKYGDTLKERRIDADTQAGKGSQGRGIVRVAGGQHAGGSEGGLSEGWASVQDCDTRTTGVQFQGERKADQAGSGDEDVGAGRR